MYPITRRQFCGMALVLGSRAQTLFGATGLDEILRTGIERRRIPAAVGMTATADKITYAGAFGTRDSASGINVTTLSVKRRLPKGYFHETERAGQA